MLIALGCVHVCLHFAVGVGSSGVCMFQQLIVMFILVLNCEVLGASLVGLGTICKCYILFHCFEKWAYPKYLHKLCLGPLKLAFFLTIIFCLDFVLDC